MQNRTLLTVLIGWSGLFSTAVLAHTGDTGVGLIGSLLHPLTGVDHVFASFLAAACIILLARKKKKL